MQVTRIEGTRGLPRLNLHELWEFRELLGLLVWRDLRIRYKQTILGAAWVILPTLLTGLLFALVFGRWGGLGSDHIPYLPFYLAAVLPWNFFSNIVQKTAGCLTSNSHIIKKVYFPRLLLALEAVITGFVDLLITSSLLIFAMIWYGLPLRMEILLLPILILMAALCGLAIGLWAAAFNAYFRDVNMILPHMIQIWFFMTPIVYSTSIFPPTVATIAKLNPMGSVVNGFRWSLYGTGPGLDVYGIASTFVFLIILITGAFYFRHVERTSVDVV